MCAWHSGKHAAGQSSSFSEFPDNHRLTFPAPGSQNPSPDSFPIQRLGGVHGMEVPFVDFDYGLITSLPVACSGWLMDMSFWIWTFLPLSFAPLYIKLSLEATW